MKDFFRLLSYFKNHKANISLSVVSNILYVFFSFFSLTLIAPFMAVLFGIAGNSDNAHPLLKETYRIMGNIQSEYGSFKALLFIAALFLIFSIFSNLFRYLGTFFLAPVRSGVVGELRKDFYASLMNHPLDFFSESKRGDMIERATSDVNEAEWAILSSLQGLVKDPINVILFLAALISLNASLVLFVLLVLPAMFYVVYIIGKKIKKHSSSGQAQWGDIMSVTEETIEGIRVIKSFNKIEDTEEVFKKKNRLYTKRQNRIYYLRDLAAPMTEFLSVIAVLPVILYGGIEVLQGEMSADIMVLFLLLFIRLIAPTKAVITAFYNIQKGCAALERINEVVDFASPNFASPGANVVKQDKKSLSSDITFNNEIIFDKVSFKYNGSDEYALKNLSFTIPKGKTIALVGFSGAGKTTIADLIMRFYPLSEGKILIDGQDIQNISPESIRELFGYVSQMPFVWNDTIENNIRFGNTEAAFEDVVEVARKAKIHDFIISLPKGYQTITGDAGARISGGERQRIVIARAILRNAPILILDEATSSLDNIAEKQVQEALSVLMKDRTSIVIAHRLSTIVDSDIIIVMEKGEIIQTGTHQELVVQKDSAYATLFSSQTV